MNSRIYLSEVTHVRVRPLRHEFRYPAIMCGFFLDELEELSRKVRFFSYNSLNLFSLFGKDYLDDTQYSLRDKILDYLPEASSPDARVELITCPRFFNYIFNPVSFYLVRNSAGDLLSALAEVNNTFGEKHLYYLRDFAPAKIPNYLEAKHRKEFHVSPFNDMRGGYRFLFGPQEKLDIRVNLFRQEKPVLYARVKGDAREFIGAELLRSVFKYPLALSATMMRITWQAWILYFRRNLKVYTKPIAASELTIVRNAPSFFQNVCKKAVLGYLAKASSIRFVFTLSDGEKIEVGPEGAPKVELIVRNYDFFASCLLGGDIGFGESYFKGYFDAGYCKKTEYDSLVKTLRTIAKDDKLLSGGELSFSFIGLTLARLIHRFRDNTKAGSRKNISAHYDLGNEFFASFLDSGMNYSSAIFPEASSSLEEAQVNKLRSLATVAGISATDSVLEIGCGWGHFSVFLAKNYGCRVKAVTISKEQYDYARERVKREGLGDLISVELKDYRELEGKYDKIVSIEMIEAVGHKRLPQFFEKCDSLLADDGILALQVITMPDRRYEAYRKGCDWIQKHIFPGGLCPSVGSMVTAAVSGSSLVLQRTENIGLHYAKTLRLWSERFSTALASGALNAKLELDEEFVRKWYYYLAYCEAGFAEKLIGTHQAVFSRAGGEGFVDCPGYEAYEK